MSRELADAVIDYLATHPHNGPRLAVQELPLGRDTDGHVRMLCETAPGAIGLNVGLLQADLLDHVSFTNGVITLAVQPRPLHYQPVYREQWPDMVVCRRIEEP